MLKLLPALQIEAAGGPPVAIPLTHPARTTGMQIRSRADLDAAAPGQLRPGQGRPAWQHGADAPIARPCQPNEVAPCHLFFTCEDSSYMSGQVLHPNGGTPVGGQSIESWCTWQAINQ